MSYKENKTRSIRKIKIIKEHIKGKKIKLKGGQPVKKINIKNKKFKVKLKFNK